MSGLESVFCLHSWKCRSYVGEQEGRCAGTLLTSKLENVNVERKSSENGMRVARPSVKAVDMAA